MFVILNLAFAHLLPPAVQHDGMDAQRGRHVDRLDMGMVSDLHRRMLELVIVERVFLFPSHATPPGNFLKGGVYFFGVGSVRLEAFVRYDMGYGPDT